MIRVGASGMASRLVFLIAATAGLLAACYGESYGTPGMEIENGTSRSITVVYRSSDGVRDVEEPVVDLDPAQRLTQLGLHQRERPCLSGTLIARVGDEVVDTLGGACEGTTWLVTDSSAGSPAP